MKRLGLIFILLSVFSFLAFSAPSKGTGPKDKGGNSRREPPSRSPRNSNGDSFVSGPNTSKSNQGLVPPPPGRSSSKSTRDPTIPAASQQKKTAPEVQTQDEPAVSKTSNSGGFEEEQINYRGVRTAMPSDSFSPQRIKTERLSSNNISLEIIFNKILDPHSFSYSSIKIDGEEISQKMNFSFNKKGDTVKLVLPVKKERFTIEITGIKSFDGTEITYTQVLEIPK
ncbi:hypothetical protein [Treponema sp.]|uniref:hypothetical protein n=1 Tax=Treponema sp. TaxID=166 RepID=UPI0038905503